MSTSTTRITSIYITIAYTLDTILSKYHPLVPWLAMRQNNHQSIRLGDVIGFEYVYGPSFYNQQQPIYGRISSISHFVQGFIIVMASTNPQTFKAFGSQIYVAIPRQWFSLPLLSAFRYRLTHKSLLQPRFLHLLDQSHGVYQSNRFKENIEGSRTVQKVKDLK